MTQEDMSTAEDDDTMELVEGVLSEINVELGRENLLEKIDARYRSKSAVAGVGAAVSDMFGQAVAAASVAMYDGEDTQNFMCLIDGQVMCGQFGGAEWLKEGNRVRAAVSRRDNVLVTRAILDEAQGFVWVGHPWGARAEMNANWSLAWWCYLFGLAAWASAYMFLGGRGTFWETMWFGAVCGFVVCFGMALWANRDMQALAAPSTETFRLLGFDKPENVNLNEYQIKIVASRRFLKAVKTDHAAKPPAAMDLSAYQSRNVYDYKQAIADGKLALSSRSDVPA